MIIWLYNIYDSVIEWGENLYNILTTSLDDILENTLSTLDIPDWLDSLLDAAGIDGLAGLVPSWISDWSIFEFCIGGGVFVWFVVTVVIWILDILP